MAVSKAQQASVNKYVKSNYDRINVTMPKGEKEVIQGYAAAHGESVNGFIVRAVRERMERDSGGFPTSGESVPTSWHGGGEVVERDAPQGVAAPKSGHGAGGPQEAVDGLQRFASIPVQPNVLEAARRAAEDAGEAVAVFIARAVEMQVKRDQSSLAMGINPATVDKLNQASKGGTEHE